MAKRKKETPAITAEERLKEALVPENEQPYQIPSNWCWVKAGYVCNFERGITFPASAKEAESTDENIPCLRTANVQDELELDDLIFVDKSYLKNNKSKLVLKDDIIMSSANSRELVGKTSYVHDVFFPMTFGGFVLVIRTKDIISKYLFYYLRFEFLAGHFMDESTQTTNIANISTAKLGEYFLALPPIAEQKRIVTRIESLFSKLDEAEEKLQSVLDSFETQRTAILHKAFTGELTAKWRADKSIDIAEWGKKRIKEVCEARAGYAFDSEKFITHGYQVIRMGNLYNGILDLSKKPVYYSESDLDEKILQKSAVRHGDILITLTGTKYKRDYGYAVCILNPDKLLVNQRILCLTPLEVVNRKFLLFFLQSDIFRDVFFSNETGGVNQGNVSSKFVENIELPFPNKEEQIEIARILNNLLNKGQVIKENIECIISRIKTIKKSILSKAFHGELGTNNPDDENAKELIKRILG